MYFEHAKVLEEIYKRREQDLDKAQFNLLESEHHMDTLTMIGVGLGYHIETCIEADGTRNRVKIYCSCCDGSGEVK